MEANRTAATPPEGDGGAPGQEHQGHPPKAATLDKK